MEISRWCVRFRVRARAVKGKVGDETLIAAMPLQPFLAQCYPQDPWPLAGWTGVH